MTSADIAFRIQADLGPTWLRNRPLPNEVVEEICEALWQEGVNPNRRIVQQRMPVWNDHAFGPGIVAWRKRKGLSEQGTRVPYALPTNLARENAFDSANSQTKSSGIPRHPGIAHLVARLTNPQSKANKNAGEVVSRVRSR